MSFESHFNIENVLYLENKIFKDHLKLGKDYNGFKDISINQKERIENLSTSFLSSNYGKLNCQNYIIILRYLSTALGREKLVSTRDEFSGYIPTYDELLTFAITSLDPECKMFTNYLKCNNNLSEKEKRNAIRNEIGFFSKFLLDAEKDYYFKFINELLTDVSQDNSSYINLIVSSFKSFDNVSIERFESISKMADMWNFVVSPDKRFATCTYNLIHQAKLLGLKSLEERIIFFIAAVDPDLKLLSIYSDENRTDVMRRRSLDEVGIYNPRLIKIEEQLKEKFMPNKKVSEWYRL